MDFRLQSIDVQREGAPRLWSFDRPCEVAAVDRATKNPVYRQACYDIIDAVLEIRQSGQLRDEHLAAFAKGMSYANEFVFCTAGKRLAECASSFQAARELLERLAAHPKWQVRFNTICTLLYAPPRNLMLSILRRGIRDRSTRVRAKAVDVCVRMQLAEMLPDLEARRAEETDPQCIIGLDVSIALIQGQKFVHDGRALRKLPDGSILDHAINGGGIEDLLRESVFRAVQSQRRRRPDSPGKQLLRRSQLKEPVHQGGETWLVYDVAGRGRIYFDGRAQSYRHVSTSGDEAEFSDARDLIRYFDSTRS